MKYLTYCFKQMKCVFQFLEQRDKGIDLDRYFVYLFSWEEKQGNAFMGLDLRGLHMFMLKIITNKSQVSLPVITEALIEFIHPTTQ